MQLLGFSIQGIKLNLFIVRSFLSFYRIYGLYYINFTFEASIAKFSSDVIFAFYPSISIIFYELFIFWFPILWDSSFMSECSSINMLEYYSSSKIYSSSFDKLILMQDLFPSLSWKLWKCKLDSYRYGFY